jgi:hypothetical protein
MDWEERYQTGDTPWEKGVAAPPLLEWFANGGVMVGDVLVPGCGCGHDVRAISAASPDARVVGLDIAPSGLDQARKFALAGQETYQLANLLDLPDGLANRFDWVFEHTCFCAIDPRQRPDYVEGVGRLFAGHIFSESLGPWRSAEEGWAAVWCDPGRARQPVWATF